MGVHVCTEVGSTVRARCGVRGPGDHGWAPSSASLQCKGGLLSGLLDSCRSPSSFAIHFSFCENCPGGMKRLVFSTEQTQIRHFISSLPFSSFPVIGDTRAQSHLQGSVFRCQVLSLLTKPSLSVFSSSPSHFHDLLFYFVSPLMSHGAGVVGRRERILLFH